MHKIAVIAGDGIGKEVIPAGMAVLEAAAKGRNAALTLTGLPWGWEYYLKHHRMLDEDGFERLAGFDADFICALGFSGGSAGGSVGVDFVHPQPFCPIPHLPSC